MVKVEHSVLINRPVQEVFAYMTRPEHTPEWQSGMVASAQRSEGPMAVGTIFTEVRKMMGREMEQTMEVTAYRPNRQMSFRSIEAAVPHEAHVTFEAVGAGTRVSLTSIARPEGLLKLMAPFIGRQLRKAFAADFERLKQLLESQSGAG